MYLFSFASNFYHESKSELDAFVILENNGRQQSLHEKQMKYVETR